ncbi:MAG: TRZ/ATZ family hydrolase [Pseudomonadota bacterium]
MPPLHADLLIHAAWVIPVEPDARILSDHSVAVRDGQIVELLPTDEADQRYVADRTHRLDRHALIPGFINAHTHASMALFRGLADDLPLMTWLHDHVWPAESRWVSDDFVADGTRLAIAEMIRSGTTCFNDMYFFPEISARVAAQAGIRAMIGLIVLDFPSAWADGPDTYLSKGTSLHDEYQGHPLIRTAFAPHAPYSVSDEPLGRIRTLADELEIPVHIHLHETLEEVRGGLADFGKRPFARLDELGLVNPGLVAVHMTQMEDAEIARLAETRANVVHCPESNLKLASGFCQVKKMQDAGVNLCLGTDGAASNNDLDMLGEMRSAALLAKGVSGDARALPAFDALRMATLGGAIALGMADRVGSIRAGKSADLVAVDLGHLATSPVYNPLSQLVYAAGRDQVTDVWVKGHQLLRDGLHTTLDAELVQDRAGFWRDRVAQT